MNRIPIDDAHTHWGDPRMEELLNDEVVQELQKLGLRYAVVCGTRREDWIAVARMARRFPQVVLPAFGLHPWNVLQTEDDSWKTQLISWLTEFPDAILGEIGLDYYAQSDAQTEAFTWQWRLACEWNRILEVHCVGSWGDLQTILRNQPLPKKGWMIHGFNGSFELAKQWSQHNCYFSFNIGMVRNNNFTKISELYRKIPLENLLIETDSPHQSPQVEYNNFPTKLFNGKPINDPRNLWTSLKLLANWRGLTQAELAAALRENFQRLFLK